MILYAEDLRNITCSCDECKNDGSHSEMFIRPKCHPHASPMIGINGMEGIVSVYCSECEQSVAQIAIGSRPDSVNIDLGDTPNNDGDETISDIREG